MAYTDTWEGDPWGAPGTTYPRGSDSWEDRAKDWLSTQAGTLWDEASTWWNSLTRGDAPWGYYAAGDPHNLCPGTPNLDAVSRAVERGPEREINWIIQTLSRGNGGRGPKSRGELLQPDTLAWWVKALMGGRDCAYDRPEEGTRIRERFTRFVAGHGAPGGGGGGGNGFGPVSAGTTRRIGQGLALALVGAMAVSVARGQGLV